MSTLPSLLATDLAVPVPARHDEVARRHVPPRGLRPPGAERLRLPLRHVDNTPPNGSAGADQTVAKGSKAIIVTGAADATSGLASVKVDFGDNHRQSQPAAKLADPITHAYSKLGTFTVVVTITDRAGNVTSDSARIRVASTVTPRSAATSRASSSARGARGEARRARRRPARDLHPEPDRRRKLTKRVTFTKASQRIKVSLATRGPEARPLRARRAVHRRERRRGARAGAAAPGDVSVVKKKK